MDQENCDGDLQMLLHSRYTQQRKEKKIAHCTVEMDQEEGETAQMKVSSNSQSGPLKYLKLHCVVIMQELFAIFIQERNATKSHHFGQKNKYLGIK